MSDFSDELSTSKKPALLNQSQSMIMIDEDDDKLPTIHSLTRDRNLS